MSFTRTYTIKPLQWKNLNGKRCAVCEATGLYVAYWQTGSGKWAAEAQWNNTIHTFPESDEKHMSQMNCENYHRAQITKQLVEHGVL